jgi:hypothetical protein
LPSKGIMSDVLLDRPEWPAVLTPEQREQLLLDKLARVQHAVKIRRKLPQNIRAELNIVCCNVEQCQHN